MIDKARQQDEIFMGRAIELAALGIGSVSPNPLVGCVIVHQNKIIGEGWHQRYGEAHAEVHAVKNVKEKEKLKNSTAYVTLEPCTHYGKTPPCVDLMIQHNINRVVIANHDPFPVVNGSGIETLQKNGIEVATGLLSDQSAWVNRRFLIFQTLQRPYIILKWAQTADGYLAQKNFDSKWISNQYSRLLVHQWRTEEDAILVGYNTALHDNPKLNVRQINGTNPTRIVIDPKLVLPPSHHLFDKNQKTIIYNYQLNKTGEDIIYKKVKHENLCYDILKDLYARKIQSVIVEGGSSTINKFIQLNLWDEMRVFTASHSFGEGIPAPLMKGEKIQEKKIQNDRLEIFINSHARRINHTQDL